MSADEIAMTIGTKVPWESADISAATARKVLAPSASGNEKVTYFPALSAVTCACVNVAGKAGSSASSRWSQLLR